MNIYFGFIFYYIFKRFLGGYGNLKSNTSGEILKPTFYDHHTFCIQDYNRDEEVKLNHTRKLSKKKPNLKRVKNNDYFYNYEYLTAK